MTRLSEIFLLSGLQLDEQKPAPLYQQLYEGFRQAILSGQFTAGARLPSIRDLSRLLNISRNTVTHALDELIAEGYLETKQGAGTFIVAQLPDELSTLKFDLNQPQQPLPIQRRYSRRSQLITPSPQNWMLQNLRNPAFQYGLPALDHFPHDIWANLTARQHRDRTSQNFDFTSTPAGYRPLREAIVEHLRSARGVSCKADNVIIVSGAHQGIYLAALILLDPGDKILVEEPGFTSTHRTFNSVGGEIVPVPLDPEGFNIALGVQLAPEARVAFVKPSRQHPTGRTMGLERRWELINWAQNVNGWIIEDDYGSEFNYSQRPLPALQGLDVQRRVIYIGTFSKALFPALRLGYVVAPDDLVDKFMSLRSIIDSYISTTNQVTLADFIEQGHFTRHLRRMRQLYAERQAIFLREAEQLLAGLLQFESTHAGTSVAAWLPDGINDLMVQQFAEQEGITVMPISPCYLTEPKRQGLLFGYAACDEATIRAGLLHVKAALQMSRS